MRTVKASGIIPMLLAGALILCASSCLPWKSAGGTSSGVMADKNEGTDTANSYCEFIVCVGEIKEKCEMRIRIMDGYEATLQQADGGTDVLEVNTAISIEYLKDWIVRDSFSLDRFKSGDKLLYRNYKKADTDYYARYHSSLIRVTRKIRLDEQAPGYKYTFSQIFQAAEALAHRNNTQLGAETLLVKKRFNIVPSDPFFISPIKYSELY